MSTKSISIFLLASLLIFTASTSELQRFNLRSLATTDSVTERDTFVKYDSNTVVLVNLGNEYLSRNNMTSQNQTALIVRLYSNATSFNKDCTMFQKYNCTNNTCNADTTIKQSDLSPYVSLTEANPITQSVSIGNSATPAWKASKASLFSLSGMSWESIQTPAGIRSEVSNYSTYGFLGLGVGGAAASNFRGDHPLFSISINSTTGAGQLIFGKDSSLYNASTTPITLKTDTNWTVVTKKMTFGSNYSNSSYVSKLVFDLQTEGISIPYGYYSSSNRHYNLFLDALQNISNVSTSNREDNFYTFTGNLSSLPNFVFSLENGQNLTIPPAAYTKKSKLYNNTFVILIGTSNAVSGQNNTQTNFTVLGQSVLSYFYTIFEQKKGAEPTVTLYSADGSQAVVDSSSGSTPTSFGGRVVQIAVVLALLVVAVICLKNRASAKLKEELYVELNETKNQNAPRF